jgi:DNA-binding NarL/FixJ family response regulator
MSREWLAHIIGREHDLTVCAEGGDLPSALALITAELPSLVILESPLHGVHSFDLLKQIRSLANRVPILVFGETVSGSLAEAAVRAGARGYIHRRESKIAVIAAIHRVLGGGVHVSEANADAMLRHMCSIDTAVVLCGSSELSVREREVLTLLGSGYKPAAIAIHLRVSTRTIESYTNRIRQKLNIATASELVLIAVAWMRSQPV